MELRFDRARATRDIDLTYLERYHQTPKMDVSEEIFEDLLELSKEDMNDFFTYRIEEAQRDLDNAPYGGARFPVTSLVDGRLFVRFQLDIGLDVMVNKVDQIKGGDWLDFCEISPPVMSMITKEQQFAEKIHAYSIPRDGRMNTRVKDLIDLLLLVEQRDIDLGLCRTALQTIFKVRGTHELSTKLSPPPNQWEELFRKMAQECGVISNLSEAYERVRQFYKTLMS